VGSKDAGNHHVAEQHDRDDDNARLLQLKQSIAERFGNRNGILFDTWGVNEPCRRQLLDDGNQRFINQRGAHIDLGKRQYNVRDCYARVNHHVDELA
jgi:hypothetical protein